MRCKCPKSGREGSPIAGERAVQRLGLPEFEADLWLIGRMLANAVLEIAFADERIVDRDVLVAELVRLTLRMLQPGGGIRLARRP